MSTEAAASEEKSSLSFDDFLEGVGGRANIDLNCPTPGMS